MFMWFQRWNVLADNPNCIHSLLLDNCIRTLFIPHTINTDSGVPRNSKIFGHYMTASSVTFVNQNDILINILAVHSPCSNFPQKQWSVLIIYDSLSVSDDGGKYFVNRQCWGTHYLHTCKLQEKERLPIYRVIYLSHNSMGKGTIC